MGLIRHRVRGLMNHGSECVEAKIAGPLTRFETQSACPALAKAMLSTVRGSSPAMMLMSDTFSSCDNFVRVSACAERVSALAKAMLSSVSISSLQRVSRIVGQS